MRVETTLERQREHGLPEAPYRPVPALHCYLAYLSALAAAPVTWWLLVRFQVLTDPFWIGLAVTCAATLVIWIYSIANNNSSIYDPYWVIAPPFLALALKAAGSGLAGPWNPAQVMIAALLFFWAARYHLFYAWSGWRTGLVHEDWRYEKMRSAPVPYWLNSLLGMHLFPTLLVYFAFAPAALVLLAEPGSFPSASRWYVLGTAMAVTAVVIQFMADRQLKQYRESDEYARGGAFRQGLWAYSRHPNYFGEVLFWASMVPFAAGAGVLSRYPLLTLAGPIAMAVFFRFSAHLMDKRSLARRPEYREVMEQVSGLVPWFPRDSRP